VWRLIREIKQEFKRKKKHKLRKKGGGKPKEREKIERKHGGASSINQYASKKCLSLRSTVFK
jgi:hypothetical protein